MRAVVLTVEERVSEKTPPSAEKNMDRQRTRLLDPRRTIDVGLVDHLVRLKVRSEVVANKVWHRQDYGGQTPVLSRRAGSGSPRRTEVLALEQRADERFEHARVAKHSGANSVDGFQELGGVLGFSVRVSAAEVRD
jgi:hypothetical protein